MNILSYFFIFLLLGLPLVIWSYIFSYFGGEQFSRKNFFIGLFSGAVVALFLWIFSHLGSSTLLQTMFGIFSYSPHSLFSSLLLFTALFTGIWIAYLLVSCIPSPKISEKKIPFLQFLLFLIIFVGILIVYYLFFQSFRDSQSQTRLSVVGLVFQGFISITGYYLLISFLEEGLKSFGGMFYGLKADRTSYGDIIVIGASLGLGFAFLENILYFISFFGSSGGEEVLSFLFFRSIFTVMLHVIASICIIGALSLVYRFHSKKLFIIFALLGVGIMSHSFFDIALTYNYIGIIFFYSFILYLILTYRAYARVQ